MTLDADHKEGACLGRVPEVEARRRRASRQARSLPRVQLRDDVREDVEGIADLSLVPGDIPEVRNRLSHGQEDYTWSVLQGRMRSMSAIGVAHLLRRLDLPRDRLARVLG